MYNLEEQIIPVLTALPYESGRRKYIHNEELLLNYVNGIDNPGHVSRLRLDWELAKDVEPEDISKILVRAFVEDLEDLVQNGDVDNTSDVLYKVLDGAKKRGKEPKVVEAIETVLVEDTSRELNEYTAFVLLYTEW